MKIDRLIGILTVLLQKDKVTAPELAERFEVSRRTINRGLRTLLAGKILCLLICHPGTKNPQVTLFQFCPCLSKCRTNRRVCLCGRGQLRPALAVNQQPARLNVAFPVACVVPGQIVVCVLWRQGGGYAERVNDLLELSHLPTAFHAGLKVFLEFCGVPYLKHFSPPSARQRAVLSCR